MTLGLKQQSKKNVYKTRKLPFRRVHCNTCMISLFVILWTIPSWNIGQTIKKRKTAKLSWFWTIPISRKFTDLGIVWVFNLCAEPSSPHHLRLVGWAGIHTNYQITQGPLRRPPSSNQSNSIRFRLWFPNWCWHSHCLTLYIERVNSFFVACFCGVDDREVLMTKVWGNKNLTAILLNFQIRVNQNRFLDSANWARKRKQIMKIITFGPKIAERKIWKKYFQFDLHLYSKKSIYTLC